MPLQCWTPSLRVWVEAPTFLPQLWAFTPTPVPTPVEVLHDTNHPSRLVLPKVPNDPERIAAPPTCSLVIRQPCRPDPLSAASAPGTGGGGPTNGGSDETEDPAAGQPTGSSAGGDAGAASLPTTGAADLGAVAGVGRGSVHRRRDRARGVGPR